MRVLFLSGEFPPMQGGVGACTNEIAHALAALGVNVCVLTAQAASSKQAAGSDAIRNSQFAIRTIKKWDWSCLRAIANVVHEFAPDIIHIQYQTAAYGMHPAINFLPLLIKRRAPSVKIVFTYHDLKEPYLFPKAGWFRRFVTQFPARISDAVIATNEEDFFSLSALRLRLLTLIPIGSNIPTAPITNYQLPQWRRQLGIQDDEILLCYFGFLNESKGGETLIRALALVPNAKLLMIGGQVGASDPTNVAYLAKVKQEIRDLGLENRVIWTDYTPPEIVTANFRASDLCVLPYRDGASYRRGTLMAALAHGMAIVTTESRKQKAESGRRSTACPERSRRVGGQQPALSGVEGSAVSLPPLMDGENCLLVPPGNPRALADAIQRAARSLELRTKIGAGARELAQHFTWDKIAEQHLELYQRIANIDV